MSFIVSQSEASLVVCSVDILPLFLEIGEDMSKTLKEIVVMDLNEVSFSTSCRFIVIHNAGFSCRMSRSRVMIYLSLFALI